MKKILIILVILGIMIIWINKMRNPTFEIRPENKLTPITEEIPFITDENLNF